MGRDPATGHFVARPRICDPASQAQFVKACGMMADGVVWKRITSETGASWSAIRYAAQDIESEQAWQERVEAHKQAQVAAIAAIAVSVGSGDTPAIESVQVDPRGRTRKRERRRDAAMLAKAAELIVPETYSRAASRPQPGMTVNADRVAILSPSSGSGSDLLGH